MILIANGDQGYPLKKESSMILIWSSSIVRNRMNDDDHYRVRLITSSMNMLKISLIFTERKVWFAHANFFEVCTPIANTFTCFFLMACIPQCWRYYGIQNGLFSQCYIKRERERGKSIGGGGGWKGEEKSHFKLVGKKKKIVKNTYTTHTLNIHR